MESKKRNYRLLISDESGNPGPNTGNEIEYFVLGATSTKDVGMFERIPDQYWSNTRSKCDKDRFPPGKGELKYGTSSDEVRSSVIDEISKIDNEVYALIVKKYPHVNSKKGTVLYKSALEYFMKNIFDILSPDTYTVYLDDSWYITNRDVFNLFSEINMSYPDKRIEIRKSGLKDSKLTKAIQINDFVVGSLRNKYVDGKDGYGLEKLNIKYIGYMNSDKEKH